MLNQSFSFENLRTIHEIENRKGNYFKDFYSVQYNEIVYLLQEKRKEIKLEKGRLIFKKLFQFINSEYDEVQSIRGTWRDSEGVADNLITFNEFILKKKTVSEAAFETFTGKMANELSFKKVKIIELTSLKKPDGTYSSVDIIFYK